MNVPIPRRRVVVEPHADRRSAETPFWFSVELSEHDDSRFPLAHCATYSNALILARQAAEQYSARLIDRTGGAE